MVRQAIDPDLASRLEEVGQKMNAGVDTQQVRAVLEEMLSTMSGNIGSADPRMLEELEELSLFIEQTKAEIAAINPEEIPDEHIPEATDELDAVIEATEVATNSIMEAAEMIESVAEEVTDEQADVLSQAVTQIYEACSFQDITGQRIHKVVGALKEIERKVETVVEKFGPDRATRDEKKRKRQAEKESAEADATDINEEDLLQGPQLAENANSQDDIDALLADMG
ncbi:MAG: chemotaxis protein CheZ [Alphaproteobacteria bacterium]|jgi:chemotaxis protein CheZ